MEPTRHVVIETEHGPVRGIKKTSILGRDFFNFQGIPYMKPPMGKLRFREPQPPDEWIEPLDVSEEPPSYCFYHASISLRGGQEDASVLNVYVPVNWRSDLLPVMVWIHGGGFQMGSSKTDIYGPDYLLQKDVIVVTFNYRMGPVGFLSLNHPSLNVPGNAGLKDQLMALKWIQKNIRNFGGDPESVTLFGDSAGAASVHFHMISDQSRGLFHRAILMSGCAFNKTWCLPPKKNFAQRLGKKLGWNGSGGDEKLLEFLEGVDAVDLMQHSRPTEMLTNEEFCQFFLFAFCPVIEPYLTESTFISKDPLLMARDAWSKNMDLVIGATSFEGALATIFERNENFIETFEDPKYFAPSIELGSLVFLDDDATRFGTRIKKIYFEYAHLTNTNYELFSQYATDRHFWHGIHNVVKSRLNSDGSGKTFLYRFDASTELNMLKTYNKAESFTGATHGDTIFYIFSCIHLSPPLLDSKEFEMISRMIDWMTSFAASGDPNCADISKWEPVTSLKPPLTCLNISEKKTEQISLPESDRLMIWDTVYKDAKVQMY